MDTSAPENPVKASRFIGSLSQAQPRGNPKKSQKRVGKKAEPKLLIGLMTDSIGVDA